MLTVGSLFSGIGGFDLGLERAGMRVIWQSEIDPYASAVLRKHWPDVPNHGDIRGISAGTVERPDVICGGFPCQPSSVAGKRMGADDDRWLWPEYRRLVEELRPAWVFGENVVGIVSMELDNVLADLEALGYSARAFDIPACAVGAHHERRRIWIVAHSDDGGLQEVAHAVSTRQPGSRKSVDACNPAAHGAGQAVDAVDGGISGLWRTEPDVGRVAHGVPNRVDRLRCLGNAIVPQVAEIIGRAILSAA